MLIQNQGEEKGPGSYSKEMGCCMVEPRDEAILKLFGGLQMGGVTITKDQYRELARWAGIDLKTENQLEKAANQREVMRMAQHVGMRMIAFLAGGRLLDAEEDPVKTLSDFAEECLGIEDPYPDEEG